MSPRGQRLGARFSAALEDLRALAELDPSEAHAIVCALGAELRAMAQPLSLTEQALGTDA